MTAVVHSKAPGPCVLQQYIPQSSFEGPLIPHGQSGPPTPQSDDPPE